MSKIEASLCLSEMKKLVQVFSKRSNKIYFQNEEGKEDLNIAYKETKRMRMSVLIKEEDNIDDVVKNKDSKMWVMHKGIGRASMPTPPDDWKAPPRKKDMGEPCFDSIDNPGGWCDYTFRPKFATDTKKGVKIRKGIFSYTPNWSNTGFSRHSQWKEGDKRVGVPLQAMEFR